MSSSRSSSSVSTLLRRATRLPRAVGKERCNFAIAALACRARGSSTSRDATSPATLHRYRVTAPTRLALFSTARPLSVARKPPSTAVTRVWNPQDDLNILPEYGIPIEKKRQISALAVLLWFMPVCTFGLGVWQLYRLGWKLRRIEDMEDRLEMPIVRLPKIISQRTFDDLQFRRVYVTGEFLHDKEMHLGPRVKVDLGSGYYIITPLRRENGQIILVKRGWVDRHKQDRASRPLSILNEQSSDEAGGSNKVRIVGTLRGSELPNLFIPAEDAQKNEWYTLNVEAMAEHAGAEPILVQALTEKELSRGQTVSQSSRGIPIAEEPVVDLRNTHMQYAVTWFGVSAGTALALALFFKKKPVNKFGRKR